MYPFSLLYAAPWGPFPTGIVATTVPPAESGVGAWDARLSVDWVSSAPVARRRPKGPPPMIDGGEIASTVGNDTTANVIVIMIANVVRSFTCLPWQLVICPPPISDSSRRV